MIDTVKDFCKYYNCIITESKHVYHRPVVVPLDSATEHMTIETERGIDLTFMREHFDHLIEDANRGREHRTIARLNPAVQEAYNQYRMLLELTRTQHGRN